MAVEPPAQAPASGPLATVGRFLPPDALTASGFVSYQAQLVDAQGNGLHLSWGYGGPEHPDWIRGTEHPGLSPHFRLMIHAAGEPVFEIHQHHDPKQAPYAPGRAFLFGKNRMEIGSDGKMVLLIAHFDAALPRSKKRLTGYIELGGEPLVQNAARNMGGVTLMPLCGFAKSRAILNAGETQRFHLEGHGGLMQIWAQQSDAKGAESWGWGVLPFDREIRLLRFWDTAEARVVEADRFSMSDDPESWGEMRRDAENVGTPEGQGMHPPQGMLLRDDGQVFVQLEDATTLFDHPTFRAHGMAGKDPRGKKSRGFFSQTNQMPAADRAALGRVEKAMQRRPVAGLKKLLGRN
jgi:hypothetical protein